MINWLDQSNNANTFSSSYLEGFLDVSGTIINRNSNDVLVNTGDVNFLGELSVNEDISFNQNLFAIKDVSLNGKVFINGDISWNSTNFSDNSIQDSALQNIQGIITGNLIPDNDIVYDLGSSSRRFRDLYLSGKTLNLGNTSISANDNNAVNLPSNTVLNGETVKGIQFAGTVENASSLVNLSNVDVGIAYIDTSTNEAYLSTGINEWLNLGVISGSTGITGPNGDKGEKGVIGIDGSKGNDIGPTGETGDKGSPFYGDGVTGPKGNIGINGLIGSKNSKGIQGEQGLDGPKNEDGQKGEQGFKGLKGEIGEKGVIGFKGTQGSKGQKGIIGDSGSQGLKGEKGEKGENGNQGPSGQKGIIGETGSQGSNGEKGEKGFKGIIGENGQKGIIGDTGSQGSKGINGSIGFTGMQGLKGVVGAVGATGPIDFISNVVFSKRLFVENDVSLNRNVDTNGQIHSFSSVIIDSSSNITGTIKIGSNLVSNSIRITETELSANDVTITESIDSNILVSTNNATNLLNTDISKNLTFDDNSRLFVESGVDVNINNKLYVNKNTDLQNDLYVKGDIISDGEINLSKYGNNYIIESNTNNYQINAIETFEVKNNSNINNDTTVSENIFINRDANFNKNVYIENDISWNLAKFPSNSIYNSSLLNGGITGVTGIQGFKGEEGNKGELGFQLLETVTGPKGIIGPKGITGIKGEKNPYGFVGPKGDIGYPDTFPSLTLNGDFHMKTLSIQNDLSWSPSTTFTNNIINPHSISGFQTDMPDHTIALWSGNSSTIPSGWSLCDGANNTPDLRSKFVIGHDSRDLSFNIDMSGASYLLDAVGSTNKERNAFFIGDISDNGSWVDENGNRNAIDPYTNNVFYSLAYIIKNIGATDVSNSFTFEDLATFQGDISFSYSTPGGIELRSIKPVFNYGLLQDTSFNKDLSIDTLITNDSLYSNSLDYTSNTSIENFEDSITTKNVVVNDTIRSGGNVNIPPVDNTFVRAVNDDNAIPLTKNEIKSNRNEFDGNLVVNNTIKTKNNQEGVNLIDPLAADQNTQLKDTQVYSEGKTFGRFNTLAMNGEGNIIVYGEKHINSLEYPKNEGKIIVKIQNSNGNWVNYGNEISTQFCSVDINDEGNILAVGNKYAEDTSIFKEQIPYYSDGSDGNIEGTSILADITGNNKGRYVFHRQYTNYKIYQDGEVKMYKYNDSTNTWEPMNMGYTRYHNANGIQITKGEYYNVGLYGISSPINFTLGNINSNYYTTEATSSSIVPFEPFQAFGNLVKLNKAGNRVLVAPEGHGGYNVGKRGGLMFNGKPQSTFSTSYFQGNGFYGGSPAETRYRVAHVYEYNDKSKLWKQLGSPIVVWDGECCGYDEWMSSPFFYWESRHDPQYADNIVQYQLDNTLLTYDEHKSRASSLGMRLASITTIDTLNTLKTYSGNRDMHLGNSYDFSNEIWEANEVSNTTAYNNHDAEFNQGLFYTSSNWLKYPMDLSFNKHLPTNHAQVAQIENISGTKKLSAVPRDTTNYAIYELYREYREIVRFDYAAPILDSQKVVKIQFKSSTGNGIRLRKINFYGARNNRLTILSVTIGSRNYGNLDESYNPLDIANIENALDEDDNTFWSSNNTYGTVIFTCSEIPYTYTWTCNDDNPTYNGTPTVWDTYYDGYTTQENHTGEQYYTSDTQLGIIYPPGASKFQLHNPNEKSPFIQAGEYVPYVITEYGTLIKFYKIITERYFFFVNTLKTFDQHLTDSSYIYSTSDSNAYYHQHLIDEFGAVDSDPRGKPFREFQSLANIVDSNTFTQVQNTLGNNTSAFINCIHDINTGFGWRVPLDTYPYYNIDTRSSLTTYDTNSEIARKRIVNEKTSFNIPNLYVLNYGESVNIYNYNSNIIHDNWHTNEPKYLHSSSKAPAHVLNIYKDANDGRIKVSGYTNSSTIENISVQYGNTGNQSVDETYNFYRIPARFIAGETYLLIYNTHDIDLKYFIAQGGSGHGVETANLGTSGIYRWTVPNTYADSNNIGYYGWSGGGEGYHYYFGEAENKNHIKMRVTSSYSNTSTPNYRIIMKNRKLQHYNKNIYNHKAIALYEKIFTLTATKVVPENPDGTDLYPGGKDPDNGNTLPANMNEAVGGGNVMFSGIEKLYVKIDSISFNDEGTIAAFGLTGVGQRDILRRGMYRGAAIVCRLKNKNVADSSFNFIKPYGSGLERGVAHPLHNPEELSSCWERIGVINGANNFIQNSQTSVGFQYIGHLGSAVRLNGAGDILAVAARDSTYYNNTDNRPGWITTVGTHTRITNADFQYQNSVSYSGPTDRSSWTANNGLGGIGNDWRGGYVQVFQYASESGDIITESNNPGSNDRWQQLGGTIQNQERRERCGNGLAINKEGNILSIGGNVGYVEGPLSGGANSAYHHSRYRPGIIRNFIFRYLTYEEASQMTLSVGRSTTGKAHIGDANNSSTTMLTFDIDNKHWIQLGKDTLDFLQYTGQYNDDNDIRVVNDGNTPGYTFYEGEKYRTKKANILYPLDYHHYKEVDKTIIESGNYHNTTISDGNYDYDDETMNKIHNYYGKWSVEDCNVVMNRSGTRFMTNTFIEEVGTGSFPTYKHPSVRIIDINSNHFQNTNVSTNQNNSRIVINKNINKPTIADSVNNVEYTILDVSGNAEISQNISTKFYKSIRSITVDIGTNSSSSKTVSFSYGKIYSDISKLAFNVNVYASGSNDNKPIDASIYNYTTSNAKLYIEASSTESDKTWSYPLKATVVIFETKDFTPVAPVYNYGRLYRYPPAAVPVAGDDGTASFRGELQNQSYGNGIYRIYTKKASNFQNADAMSGTKIHDLIDFDLDTRTLMNSPDVYFYYEFPEQIYIRKVEVYLNNTTSCQVDVWNNQEPYYAYQNSSWNSIYNGSIEYKNTNTDPAIVTMDDHNYKSTRIRVRLYDLYPGISYIQPRQISFKVTF